ncbi:CvpA family protein [Curvibacter sp. CHRR-16]|uniref:CvpA family protein n=1 Tax=Curvibacter sp. CHRR-16 TaxID=2835872 RepID=UPI001BD99853|nr:CvpA family protein [Curvibacter sp. CHRR-16]MBT0571419.1 CvpA family protein [Curvibacter sp. CHRR-16]
MTAVDWLFVAVLAGSALLGAWRGLVYETLSLLSWAAAFWVAQWLGPQAAAQLPIMAVGETLRVALGFVLVFVVVVFAGGLLAWIAKKLVSAVGMGPADRALGALFGVLRAVLMLLVLTVLVGMTPLREAAFWTQATGPHWSQTVLGWCKPLMPEAFRPYV